MMLSYHRRALLLILLLSVGVRVLLLYMNYSENPGYFSPDVGRMEEAIKNPDRPNMSEFGYEISNVAYALVCEGAGFASPFGGDTGPTAWVAPGMVWFYSVGFMIFGCFTAAAIFFTYLLAIFVSVGLGILVYLVGSRFASPSVGLTAAFLFCITPVESFIYLIPSASDFNVLTFWSAALFFAFLVFVSRPSLFHVAGLGAVAGIAVLFNPVFVLCGLCCFALCWIAGREYRRVQYLSTFLVVQLVIVGPWIVHQRTMVGEWVFVKSNAPFEFYLGNSTSSAGLLTKSVMSNYHPAYNPAAFAAYRELGESKYIEEKFRESLRNFDPGTYIRATARRFSYYFFLYNQPGSGTSGIMNVGKHIVSTLPGAIMLSYLIYLIVFRKVLDLRVGLFYTFIAAYALPYLLVANMSRYTVPILVLLLVPCAQMIVSFGRILCLKLEERNGANRSFDTTIFKPARSRGCD